MKKLVWCGDSRFRLEKTADDAIQPKEHEVLVRVRAVGICGTDIHILNGSLPGVKPPRILGHEIAGEVVAVGREVHHVAKGSRVTVDSVVGCGHCSLCSQGRRQFCESGFEFGITADGGCQDYLLVPQENVHQINDRISFEEAAVLDMEVWNAVRKCGIHKTDTVLILGAGSIGLIACQIVRLLGAQRTILGDVLKGRLETAEALRMADRCLWNENGNILRSIHHETDARGMDLVIDCAGTPQSAQLAFEAVRPGGRVLLYGVYENRLDQFDLNQIVMKDIVVFGALSDRTGWDDVIHLVAAGALNLNSLITHRFSLEDGALAYNAVRIRECGLIKAVFVL